MGKGDTSETASATPAYRSVMEEYGYEVGKIIGHGSYGTVYEAYYTKQKVMVAVKIISKKKASEDYLNKFLPREIQVRKGAERRNLGLLISYLRYLRGITMKGWLQKPPNQNLGNFCNLYIYIYPLSYVQIFSSLSNVPSSKNAKWDVPRHQQILFRSSK